jgi:protein CpxP
MIKRLAFSMTLLATLALTTQALAQYAGMGQERQGGQRQHGGPNAMGDPDAQLQRMSQRLNLTDEQKDKIKPLLQDQAKQMDSLRQDSSLSQQDRWTKMQEIRQNTMKQIRPLLNADQQKQLDEMAQERGGRGGHHAPQQTQPNQQ